MAWLDLTRVLAAPEARPGTPLAPNGTGWLIAVGSPPRRRFPRLLGCVERLGGLVALGPVWADLLDIQHTFVRILLGAAPFLAAYGAPFLLSFASLRAQLGRAVVPDGLDETGPGTLVRVTGVIANQPTVPTLFRGVPSVLSRNRARGTDETRGIDFRLDLEGGRSVHVSVQGALLLDRPVRLHEPPACGPVITKWGKPPSRLYSGLVMNPPLWDRVFKTRHHEVSVGPGDRVEVCGVLDRRPAPQGEGPVGRGTPILTELHGTEKTPLLVRRV